MLAHHREEFWEESTRNRDGVYKEEVLLMNSMVFFVGFLFHFVLFRHFLFCLTDVLLFVLILGVFVSFHFFFVFGFCFLLILKEREKEHKVG